MSSFNFRGVITALVTPFKDNEVDENSLKRMIRYQLDEGIDGFVVNGTTGESPSLHVKEVESIFQLVKSEVASQVPVILGTGSNSTEKTVHMTQLADNWGADAALVVTPYYNKPPQRGLVRHFEKIAHQSESPILLYNVPSRTVTSLSAETVVELSRNSQIVGVKEASGDMAFDREIINSTPEGFVVTSGEDPTCVDLAFEGGDGAISVMAHLVPRQLKNLLQRAQNQDESAITEFRQMEDLYSALALEANPIPVKQALYLMGQIQSPELRLPLVELEEHKTAKLKEALRQRELV